MLLLMSHHDSFMMQNVILQPAHHIYSSQNETSARSKHVFKIQKYIWFF